MARVKICRLCDQENGPDELFCTAADCGVSLADVSVVDSREIERRATEDVAVEDAGSRGDDGGGERDRAAGAQASDAAACALVFPWGRVAVAGQLDIGRESGFSPISDRLDAFSTVSRRHAVVGVAQGRWTVRDLGSTNGTYVNGVRLAEGETRAIGSGDRVGFSRRLQADVEIGAAEDGSGAHGR